VRYWRQHNNSDKGDRAMIYDLKIVFLLSMLAGLSFIASQAISCAAKCLRWYSTWTIDSGFD
jgi:hypothetical protein